VRCTFIRVPIHLFVVTLLHYVWFHHVRTYLIVLERILARRLSFDAPQVGIAQGSCPAGFRIRIRIGSGFNRVSGSGFGIRIRIQEGKNDPPTKVEKKNLLKYWMPSLES
jgi:hypothetical protein